MVCPLDWGLGHATRCIPLIKSFINDGNKVIIGSSGKPAALLNEAFPELAILHLEGYNVTYPENGAMVSKMATQIPKLITAIKKEHVWLNQIIDEYAIDEVVSDNRYGLWSTKVKSVLLTHQIFIKATTSEWLLEKLLKKHFDNFDEIWIPDFEDENNLSGDLSHKKPLTEKYKFIGPLSRFSAQENTSENERSYEYDFMAIISGPEPQRKIFEQMIIEQSENSDLKGVIVKGLPNNNSSHSIKKNMETLRQAQCDNLLVFNHLPKAQFLNFLIESKTIVCRSGYSTIMDLHVLKKKALLVPTPGQTEQEYLAKYHSEKNGFVYQEQKEFDLKKGLALLNQSGS